MLGQMGSVQSLYAMMAGREPLPVIERMMGVLPFCLNVLCLFKRKPPLNGVPLKGGDVDVSRLLVDQACDGVGQNRYPKDKVATG